MLTNTIDDLIQGIKLHGVDIIKHAVVSGDLDQYKQRIAHEHLDYPTPPENVNKNNWFLPSEYKDMDIEFWIIAQCKNDAELARVNTELAEYRAHDFIPVLKQMKYIVDTLRENNIVWGVGRGSSVASYVLFLLGVHKIDSIKYDLPLEEFFKGETNG